MSCAVVVQDTADSVTLFLTLSADGSPAEGLTFSDVSVALKKAGEVSFTNKVLIITDFVEISDGFYELLLSAADLDTLGNLYIRVTGATINTELITVFVADAAPTSVAADPIEIPTTLIFGYLTDAQGEALANVSVGARVLSQPTVVHPGAEGAVLSTGLITARTDNDGFFSLSLVTGTSVDFFITAANYRRTFLVPSSNSNIFDIP